jgi:hypothetical protein
MPHQKITQAYVDGLPFQDSGTLWVHDTELAGFNLSFGQRTKTYCAAGEHRSRFIRVKIGRADVTKANKARAFARALPVDRAVRALDRLHGSTTRPTFARRPWRILRGVVEGLGWLTLALLIAGI